MKTRVIEHTPATATATSATEQPATDAAGDAQPAQPGQRARARRASPNPVTGAAPPWPDVYLAALEKTGLKEAAAKEAGKVMSTICRHRRTHPEFAEAERDALAAAPDRIHSEITRRAIYGVDTVIRRNDGSVLIKTEYSDNLLLRLAEFHETGSWRQKQQIEHSAAVVYPTRAARKAALAEARAQQQAALAAHAPDGSAEPAGPASPPAQMSTAVDIG